MNLFIAPHNDDEALFGAYTIMREKPLVLIVTDSFIQPKRGDIECTAFKRRQETINAMKLAGAPVVFAGIHDDELDQAKIHDLLDAFVGFDTIYAPQPNSSNSQHNLIGIAAERVFRTKVIFYPTYTREQLYMTGENEVVPTQEEIDLKNKMLDCYVSQINLGATRPHFDAVRNKSEWLS